MNFWNKLFDKLFPGKTAAQPDSMEEELHRLEAVYAIDPKPRKESYWRTLHPLVQSYWVYRAGWEHEDEIPLSRSDASSVFYHWGYPTGSYSLNITPRQKEVMALYDSHKEALWQQCQEADLKFRQIEEDAEREKKQAWTDYWAHYETLSPRQQSLVAWELAKRNESRGRSGFHGGMGTGIPFPFMAVGWASYQDPQWGNTEGVAFRVNKACFGDRSPLLYYLDDDGWPYEEREKTLLDIVRKYSSGISSVRVEQRRCKNWNGDEKEQRVLLFELDPAAVKQSVLLSGKPVPTKEAGEYIFVLPRCGEFYCLLGEVRDGQMIPLHKDDFCMK